MKTLLPTNPKDKTLIIENIKNGNHFLVENAFIYPRNNDNEIECTIFHCKNKNMGFK